MSDYQWPERFWPHQISGCHDTVAARENGKRRVVFTAPCGMGKTAVMCALIERASCEWASSVLYTHRRLLFDQTRGVLAELGIDHGLRAAGHKTALLRDVQLCMTQSEARAVYGRKSRELHRSDWVLADELHCFVAGTEISTPRGNTLIQNVQPGDIVHTGCGLGTVLQTIAHDTADILELEFDDGTQLQCTSGHPIFTRDGWRPAGAVGIGEIAYGRQGVSDLWGGVSPKEDGTEETGPRKSDRDSGAQVERTDHLLSVLCKEVEQSNAQPGGLQEAGGYNAEDWAQADKARRKREAIATPADGPSQRPGQWMVCGIRCHDAQEARLRISATLQGRHRKPGEDDSNRGRRRFAQQSEAQGYGRQESRSLGELRLVRVSCIKRPRPATVFNLCVSSHPSYFANGVLVHNCQGGETLPTILGHHYDAGATIVGLTATPLDLVGEWDTLVVAGNVGDGRKCGALVPAYTYCPDEPDMKAIKKYRVGEDLTDKQNRSAIMRPGIFGRVYKHWEELNPDHKPTLLFAPDVAGSIYFAEEFHKKGIPAAHIDAKQIWYNGEYIESTDANRQSILAMTETGQVQVLSNRFVLREGLDLPYIAHCIFACVFGSLKTYLQAGGRSLRAHPSLDRVCIQDHGGNYRRHGSLNENRDWELGMVGYKVTGIREEGMRDNPETEPIRCPKCGMMRLSGPKCPRCGYACHKRSREVVQVDGSLRLVEGPSYRKRYRKLESDSEDKWISMYHRAKSKKWNATFRQAEALYMYENHCYPPADLPMMPIDPQDWFEKVRDVPLERLR